MFQTYNRILLSALTLSAAAILVVALQQQPLEGDLTRTGGYSEVEFGWHGSQEYFESPFLFKVGYSLNDLDTDYDMIVLGDSFTRRSGNSWASYVAERTGWKILGFHHRDISLEALLASTQFRAKPPSIVVFETVERHAVRLLSHLQDVVSPGPLPTTHRVPLTLRPMNAPVFTLERPEKFDSFNERLSVGVHVLKTQLKQLISDEPHARVLPLRPDSPALFSSRTRDSILLLQDDFTLRQRWAGKEPAAISGYLHAELELARSDIKLVLVVFPDKLTVYADYLQDTKWQNTSVIPALAGSINMPDLEAAYAEALTQGIVDLYSPNNTHTSSVGSRLAAEAYLEFLARIGIIAPDNQGTEMAGKQEQILLPSAG